MNSIRSMERAIALRVERQIAGARRTAGRSCRRPGTGTRTPAPRIALRCKEYAFDYRYFPEPDLPPLEPALAWIEEIRASLPELPAARRARFEEEYG